MACLVTVGPGIIGGHVYLRPEKQLTGRSRLKLDAWVRCVGQAALPSRKANRPWVSDALGQMRCQDAAV